MFDTLLITTLFLLTSLLVCLLSLRLSINVKHLSLFWFITDINEFFPTSPRLFWPPTFIKVNKNLRPPTRLFWSLVYWAPKSMVNSFVFSLDIPVIINILYEMIKIVHEKILNAKWSFQRTLNKWIEVRHIASQIKSFWLHLIIS